MPHNSEDILDLDFSLMTVLPTLHPPSTTLMWKSPEMVFILLGRLVKVNLQKSARYTLFDNCLYPYWGKNQLEKQRETRVHRYFKKQRPARPKNYKKL